MIVLRYYKNDDDNDDDDDNAVVEKSFAEWNKHIEQYYQDLGPETKKRRTCVCR